MDAGPMLAGQSSYAIETDGIGERHRNDIPDHFDDANVWQIGGQIGKRLSVLKR